MATGVRAPWFDPQFFDASDPPSALASGLLYTVSAGGTAPTDNLATYSDVTLTTANDNPIELDASGRVPVAIFLLAQSYKFILKTAAGVTIKTADNISGLITANTEVQGIAGEALTAGQPVALSDGSGGGTAGRWYKADADFTYLSSQAVAVGFAVNDIALAATGTIRQGGNIAQTGLTGGTPYYISATAGSVTSTAPTNRRLLGSASSSTNLIIDIGPRTTEVVTDLSIVDGRLTLTTNVPVTTSDVTAATTVYFTPYKGNRIALYDGTNWDVYTFAQLSIALGTDTTSIGYDVFAYQTNGTVAIERLAWTNATTRATNLTTQDGVLVKTGALTRRFLGSYYTTGAGQTEDSKANRVFRNYYNQKKRPWVVLEATNSWSYATATWRQANAAAANKLVTFVPWAEDPIKVGVQVQVVNTTASSVAIGEDSVTVPTTGGVYSSIFGTAGTYVTGLASLEKIPTVGYHYYAWLEIGAGSGASTWYGDDGGTLVQSGISGEVWG